MLNNKNTLLLNLRRLGLTADECKVYLALLEEPMSHLEIARKTGVNRTKVYRIADSLSKRSLITENMNDDGRELAANSPTNLEVVLTTQEQQIKSQQALLKQALPSLMSIFEQGGQPQPDDFVVNTYEGVSGLKQMLWNELGTKDEILVLGSGAIQDLIASQRWAEKHRQKQVEAGYQIREIINPGGKISDFTKVPGFIGGAHHMRVLPKETLPLHQQIVVYNNTVAIYNWRNEQKIGIEIINTQFADTQRSIFENYWKISKKAH